MPNLIIAVALSLLAASPTAAATRNFSVQSFDGVAVEVQGRTLVVHSNGTAWGGYPGQANGPVEIRIGTHDLSAAYVNGSGGLTIDRVKGLSFDLSVQGAGSATVDRVDVDQLRVGLSGAATTRLAGRASSQTAIVRGSSSYDGAGLASRDATVGAEGPSIVRLNVTNSAKIDARGLAAVSVTGGGACTVKAVGSATVEGCR